MLLKKRRTVDQIAASIRSRNYIDDFPSAERLKLYEQWKPGSAQKVLDCILLYQEKGMQTDQQDLYNAIYYTYKRQPLLFSVKVAAILIVTAAVILFA